MSAIEKQSTGTSNQADALHFQLFFEASSGYNLDSRNIFLEKNPMIHEIVEHVYGLQFDLYKGLEGRLELMTLADVPLWRVSFLNNFFKNRPWTVFIKIYLSKQKDFKEKKNFRKIHILLAFSK